MGEYFVDLIYGMGNGIAFIDEGWIQNSHPSILAATPVASPRPKNSSGTGCSSASGIATTCRTSSI